MNTKLILRVSLIIFVIMMIYTLFTRPIAFFGIALANILSHLYIYKLMGKNGYIEFVKTCINSFRSDDSEY